MNVRIGIAGIRGRMGREIAAMADDDPEIAVVGGLIQQRPDADSDREGVKPYTDPNDLLPRIDVLVDFTSPQGAVKHAQACASYGVPLVSGTTGLDASQVSELRQAAKRTAIFHAANMSLGVNALLAVLPSLVTALGDYDVEIVEAHHRYKSDAPSGTALAMARAVATASGGPLEGRATYGREGAGARTTGEIGIHALRGGGNPGEHSVILIGDGEEVRLSIRAFSRAAYAHGALRAARLLAGMPPGWYEPATLAGFLAP